MAKKKIVSIGVELASEDIDFYDFDSDISLLDWDIIIFKPEIFSLLHYSENFEGKPLLSNASSFVIKGRMDHWFREIKDSVDSGKTVIFHLDKKREFFIHTGKKEFSGTGRNQKTTNIVSKFNNYMCIPIDLKVVPRNGSSIKLTNKESNFIASYWSDFGSVSEYKVTIENEKLTPILITTQGDKTVGAVSKSATSKGALILLPHLNFNQDNFLMEIETEDGTEIEWSDEAFNFANKYIKSIVSIDKALSNHSESTVEPEWASNSTYAFVEESTLKSELVKVEEGLTSLTFKKGKILEGIDNAGKLRGLLFEGGKALELELINALRIVGFKASNYKDENSEFDIIFSAKEGRLIGEAEGKDNKAINITKLRQLALNIHEDFERDEVQTQAKGVLFGNAYRLIPLDEREDPFTDKCKTAAVTSSTALVFTPDLFKVVHYLSNNEDPVFAEECRHTLINTIGRVIFPKIPNK